MKWEDDIRGFFITLMQSLAGIITWMVLQILFGLYFGWAYIVGTISWLNIAYYIFFLLSLWFLVRWVRKIWKYFES